MNERERFNAVLQRKPVDKIPWIARMVLWHQFHEGMGSLPEKYVGWDLWDIQRDLGVGILGRVRIYEKEYPNVEFRETKKDNETLIEWVTPVGTLTKRVIQTDELFSAEQGYVVEYPVKNPEDYGVMEYIVENWKFVPYLERYDAMDRAVRGDGTPFVMVDRAPLQELLIEYLGYEHTFYEIADHPDKVEHLLTVMTQKLQRDMWPITYQVDAPVIESADNLTGLITSPTLYRNHVLAYHKAFSHELHKRGKLLATHMDGEPKPLMQFFREAGLDMSEAFTPKPMTQVSISDARAVWGEDVIIWGGIPSSVLCPWIMSDDDFEQQMVHIFEEISPGGAFVLGVGDNIMPEADLGRVARIRELVEQYGAVPTPARVA